MGQNKRYGSDLTNAAVNEAATGPFTDGQRTSPMSTGHGRIGASPSSEGVSMSNAIQTTVTSVEVEQRMAFADAALALAGHEVTDWELRELRRRAIRGEMTTDEAIAAGVALIDAR